MIPILSIAVDTKDLGDSITNSVEDVQCSKTHVATVTAAKRTCDSFQEGILGTIINIGLQLDAAVTSYSVSCISTICHF